MEENYKFITRNDIKIFYNVIGNKSNEAIVLLPGGGLDSSSWSLQAEALKDNYYIIALDPRGMGKSDISPKYKAIDICQDIEEIVNSEGLTSFNLAGFSLGGIISQKMYAYKPEMIKRLILLNCTLGSGNPETVLPAKEVINLFVFEAALSDEDSVKTAIEFYFDKNFEKDHPDQYKYYYDKIIGNMEGLRNQVSILVSDEPLIEDYSKVTIPVLYILADDDPIVPLGNKNAVEKYLPNAQLEIIPGCHSSMIVHPEKVNIILSEFIKNN